MLRTCLLIASIWGGNCLPLFAQPQGPVIAMPRDKDQTADVRLDFLGKLWSVPVISSFPRHDTFQPSPVILPPPALVDRNIVLLQDAAGLRALQLSTGRSAWPADEQEPGFLFPPLSAANAANRSDFVPFDNGAILNEKWVGWLDGRLVVVDLAAEGRLCWTKRPGELLGNERFSSLPAGAPIPTPAGIIIPVSSQRPVSRSRLIACNFDGTIRWRTGPVEYLPRGEHGPVDSLEIQGETIFWNRGGASILAVDTSNGRIRWQTNITVPASSGDAFFLPSALLATSKTLFAIAGNQLLALEPDRGSIRWQYPWPTSVTHLIGIRDKMLIVSGRQLWGVDVQTGQVTWHTGAADTATFDTCRGLLLGESVFWPTGPELWTVHARTGRIVQRDLLEQFTGTSQGGHLTLSGDILLLMTPEQLHAFRIRLTGWKP